MNVFIEKLKKGSGIHIKESLKGSFTKWCGGNVTDECIRRGKSSSNPKIRKKATFAANARKWKHYFGGLILKHQNGGNFGLKVGNFLNSNLGKTVISGVSELINEIGNANNAANFRIEDNERIQKGKLAILNNIDMNSVLLEASNNIAQKASQDSNVHYGTIDLKQELLRIISQRKAQNSNLANLWELEQIANLNLLIQAIQGSAGNSINLIGSIGGILLEGLGAVGNYLSNRATNSSSTNYSPSTYKLNSFWSNPSLNK